MASPAGDQGEMRVSMSSSIQLCPSSTAQAESTMMSNTHGINRSRLKQSESGARGSRFLWVGNFVSVAVPCGEPFDFWFSNGINNKIKLVRPRVRGGLLSRRRYGHP